MTDQERFEQAIALGSQVTMENFAHYAQKTESRMSGPMRGDLYMAFAAFQHDLQRIGAIADDLKRRTFYQKGPLPVEILEKLKVQSPEVDSEPYGITEHQYRMLHGALGKVTEAIELFSAIHEHVMNANPLDAVNIGEELGDSDWYTPLICGPAGLDPLACRQAIIAKLAFRYPGQFFNSDASVTRSLPWERRILGHFLGPRDVPNPPQ